jgi:hypothetical protein
MRIYQLVGTTRVKWLNKRNLTHMSDSRVYIKLSEKMVISLILFSQPKNAKEMVLCPNSTEVFVKHNYL